MFDKCFFCNYGSDCIVYISMGLYNYVWFVGKCELVIMYVFVKYAEDDFMVKIFFYVG